MALFIGIYKIKKALVFEIVPKTKALKQTSD
jgi:hypothetical protein